MCLVRKTGVLTISWTLWIAGPMSFYGGILRCPRPRKESAEMKHISLTFAVALAVALSSYSISYAQCGNQAKGCSDGCGSKQQCSQRHWPIIEGCGRLVGSFVRGYPLGGGPSGYGDPGWGRGRLGGRRCPTSFNAGPAGGAITYPYYTIRGPRDFLAEQPRGIGP